MVAVHAPARLPSVVSMLRIFLQLCGGVIVLQGDLELGFVQPGFCPKTTPWHVLVLIIRGVPCVCVFTSQDRRLQLMRTAHCDRRARTLLTIALLASSSSKVTLVTKVTHAIAGGAQSGFPVVQPCDLLCALNEALCVVRFVLVQCDAAVSGFALEPK